MRAVLTSLEARPQLKLLVLAIAAVLLSWLPVLGSVLGWFETFFHELSHGVVALLTGASIVSIELNLDGSGLIRYAGSWSPALVNFSGYPGAVVCGIALYLAALGQSKSAGWLAMVLAAAILLSALLWMRDPISWLIAAVMTAILVGLWRFGANVLARFALELVAVYLMIGGIQSIWSMFGFSGRGDAKSLAEMTWLPAVIFPPIWLGLGVAALVWLWRREAGRKSPV